ncbi:LysR family transcriptional regulator [Mycolicibacterium goodii]|uniref:LysR family transcriptional regulator n=1 Tax=Mycolicibacterium goodii TaxID=134601 RepID=UPI0013045ACE|nr:LysR family transcriptional regulator [Mycolicibacterium goodii]
MAALVGVVEEGGFSAAARRLHLSQSALSQSIRALEAQLGVALFIRTSTGVRTTPAGRSVCDDARVILAHHARLLRTGKSIDVTALPLRLGLPPHVGPEILRGISRFASQHPSIRLAPTDMASMEEQLQFLRLGRLDASLLNERPRESEFDAMLISQDTLGVLLAAHVANRVVDDDGVRLESLRDVQWMTWPRCVSPRWYDEVAAVLGGHGIDVHSGDRIDWPNPSVVIAAVSAGAAFVAVPKGYVSRESEALVWCAISGHSLVQRTWAVWPADSRRRDVAQLIAALDI